MIIPDFGGFLVKNEPANFSERTHEFLPPSSVTQFHKHLQGNDGLLIQSIMMNEQLSFIKASEKVESFITKKNKELKETKSTILPGIGKIYVDNENVIQFKSNKESNYNQESFGLQPIPVETIKRNKVLETAVISEVKKRKKSTASIAFMAAASILALILASSLFLLHNGNTNQQQFIKGNLGEILKPLTLNKTNEKLNSNSKTEKVELTQTKIDNSIETDETENNTTIKVEEILVVEPAATEENKEIDAKGLIAPIKTVKVDNPDFHVVIGLFELEENANKRFAEAQKLGYSNAVIKKGRKYHRVVIPYSAETATWKQAVTDVKQTIEPGAWIWETLYK